ncbi:hypothetical protein K466DRAFT_112212 [Polyporus arcularius HHB13444]|uniref:Uncharacterized protein n=1 Tax=Polyporus arcularius HHB13444 TaxID=1314778 RepID=A0A5C3PEJ6_9APHY|nr:hypothetical protein K466DRAFT_112212 [Polyporus arcularius HHB13444]
MDCRHSTTTYSPSLEREHRPLNRQLNSLRFPVFNPERISPHRANRKLRSRPGGVAEGSKGTVAALATPQVSPALSPDTDSVPLAMGHLHDPLSHFAEIYPPSPVTRQPSPSAATSPIPPTSEFNPSSTRCGSPSFNCCAHLSCQWKWGFVEDVSAAAGGCRRPSSNP